MNEEQIRAVVRDELSKSGSLAPTFITNLYDPPPGLRLIRGDDTQ